MGQEEGQFDFNDTRVEKISRNLFDFQYVIGKGGFGKVIHIFIKFKNRSGKSVINEPGKFMQ